MKGNPERPYVGPVRIGPDAWPAHPRVTEPAEIGVVPQVEAIVSGIQVDSEITLVRSIHELAEVKKVAEGGNEHANALNRLAEMIANTPNGVDVLKRVTGK